MVCGIFFSIDGKKLEAGNFLNDKKNGSWKKYHDNGKLWEKINYKINIKHGRAQFFYQDGTLGNEENWNNGLKMDYGRCII